MKGQTMKEVGQNEILLACYTEGRSGDKHYQVKHAKLVMTSPVVFGIRKSLAEELGFVDRQVSVNDILQAIQTAPQIPLIQNNNRVLVEIAKESERGIVEIDTLKKVNADLISTLDETLKIQEEGRAKRAQAEVELTKIEQELKNKLVALKG